MDWLRDESKEKKRKRELTDSEGSESWGASSGEEREEDIPLPYREFSTTWTYLGDRFYKLVQEKFELTAAIADESRKDDQHLNLFRKVFQTVPINYKTVQFQDIFKEFQLSFRLIDPQVISVNPSQKLYLFKVVYYWNNNKNPKPEGVFPTPGTERFIRYWDEPIGMGRWMDDDHSLYFYVCIIETLENDSQKLQFVNLRTQEGRSVFDAQEPTDDYECRLIQISPIKACFLKERITTDTYIKHSDKPLVGYLIRLQSQINTVKEIPIINVQQSREDSLFPIDEDSETWGGEERRRYFGYLIFAETEYESSLVFSVVRTRDPYPVWATIRSFNSRTLYDFAIIENKDVRPPLFSIPFNVQNDNFFNLEITHLIEIQSNGRNREWVGIGRISVLDIKTGKQDLSRDIMNKTKGLKRSFFPKLYEAIDKFEQKNGSMYIRKDLEDSDRIPLRGDYGQTNVGHGTSKHFLPVFIKLVWVANQTGLASDLKNGTFRLFTSKPFLPIKDKGTVALGGSGEYILPDIHPIHGIHDREGGYIFSFFEPTGMTVLQESGRNGGHITQENTLLMSFSVGKFYSITLDFLIRDIVEVCNYDVTTTDLTSIGLGIFPIFGNSNIRYQSIGSQLYVVKDGVLKDKIISINKNFEVSIFDKQTLKPLPEYNLSLQNLQKLCFSS